MPNSNNHTTALTIVIHFIGAPTRAEVCHSIIRRDDQTTWAPPSPSPPPSPLDAPYSQNSRTPPPPATAGPRPRLLVPADALDPREPQRVAAGVAGRLLDLVARDLQHDLRLAPRARGRTAARASLRNSSVSCAISSSVTPLYALPTLTSSRLRLRRVAVPDGEGVVAERVPPLAVPVLGGGDDAVERRQVRLELQPHLPAPAGRVGRVGVLEDEPFVAAASPRTPRRSRRRDA